MPGSETSSQMGIQVSLLLLKAAVKRAVGRGEVLNFTSRSPSNGGRMLRFPWMAEVACPLFTGLHGPPSFRRNRARVKDPNELCVVGLVSEEARFNLLAPASTSSGVFRS